MLVKKIPRTYEQMCLDKLKELGTSSAAEWSEAMGYNHPNCLAKVIKRIRTQTPDKIHIYYNRKPRRYEAL